MDQGRSERRRSRLLLGTAILACLVLLAAIVPSPFSIERPGPVVDVLGDATIDGRTTPVISLPDERSFTTSGALNLLTVSIAGSPEKPTSWLSLIPALLDPAQRIAPVTEFYPEGVSEKDRDAANAVLMDGSQEQAAAAAFKRLGRPVDVELSVAGVADGGPSDGVLETGDRIVSVNGEEVGDFAELRRLVIDAGDGAPIRLGIERDGAPLEVPVTPGIPEGGDEPMLGATVSSRFDLPGEVDISLSQIGGPSAGMVFAIGITDLVTPGDLLGGLTVSGTGTIGDDGAVGPIGGLEQKMWAASRADSDLFLMPVANCGDLPRRIPDGMAVAPVAKLDDAIDAIERVADGRSAPGLELCDR